MPRLLFEKTGKAVWISHLDLMRLFQRAFKRAGLPLKHTQGFNPRPSVSIALPLSVGTASLCEILDFDLEGEKIDNQVILDRLNAALIEGIKVKEVYDDFLKIKNLAYLDCCLEMEYDCGVPSDAVEQIRALFAQNELLVTKKSKNGLTEQDILPMIRNIGIEQTGDDTLQIRARVCCQNPSLNPMQIHAAIVSYLPEAAPDHVVCTRLEILDYQDKIFR